MLIFRYFTGYISHLSLIIMLNKISVFIHLEATTGRSTLVLKELKYTCESVPFLLKLQAITGTDAGGCRGLLPMQYPEMAHINVQSSVFVSKKTVIKILKLDQK